MNWGLRRERAHGRGGGQAQGEVRVCSSQRQGVREDAPVAGCEIADKNQADCVGF